MTESHRGDSSSAIYERLLKGEATSREYVDALRAESRIAADARLVFSTRETFSMARANFVAGLVLGGLFVGTIVGFLWAVTSS